MFFSMETTYVVIFAHKCKSNTSFGTIQGSTFIWVYSQYQQNVVLLSRTEALNKNEPKDIEYMPHRLDKYIFRKI